MYRFLLFFCLCVVIFSCNNKINKEFITSATSQSSDADDQRSACKDKLSYVPDLEHLDHTPIKKLQLNFHIMSKADSTANFDQKTARVFINQVMEAANDKLGRNKPMNLPPGNDTPVVPMRYQFVLTPRPDVADDDGIYFHYDDDLYFMIGKGKDKNHYSKAVYEKYGIQKDTVLNIFVMSHHVDSLKSPTYVANAKGIGFGKWLKVGHWYYGTRDTTWQNGKPKTKYTKWNAVQLLNHEIGHCLGLRHSWRGNDGCDDTPKHPNCWNKTKTPPCDTMWSNNFMDYNAHSSAWSPCQIGSIHYNLSNKKKKIRRLLQRTWCHLDETKSINISDNIEWLGAKDLEGHIIIKDGGSLTIRCRISFPKDAKIIIHPKGKLILDGAVLENDCGEKWLGIEQWSDETSKGELVLKNSPSINNVVHEVLME
jgi:Pregnancy-associated plasma protein-A